MTTGSPVKTSNGLFPKIQCIKLNFETCRKFIGKKYENVELWYSKFVFVLEANS